MAKAKKKARGGARKARGVAKEVAVEKTIGGKTREVEVATVKAISNLDVRGRKGQHAQFEPLSCRNVPFTLELAQKLIGMEEGLWERALVQDDAIVLGLHMDKGTFIWEQACLAYAVCGWDGKERRLNGHHTSYARLLFDKAFTPQIRLAKYEIETEENLRVLYSYLDRGKSRNRGHILNCRLVGTQQFLDIPKSILVKLAQGYSFWKGREYSRGRSVDKVAEGLLNSDYQLALHVLPHIRKTLNDSTLGHMRRSGVYGAMFETFSKVISSSDTFWSQVETGLFTNIKDPAKKLKEYFQNHVTNRSHGTTSKVVSMEEIYRGSIQAFNAFRAHKELSAIRPNRRNVRRSAAR